MLGCLGVLRCRESPTPHVNSSCMAMYLASQASLDLCTAYTRTVLWQCMNRSLGQILVASACQLWHRDSACWLQGMLCVHRLLDKPSSTTTTTTEEEMVCPGASRKSHSMAPSLYCNAQDLHFCPHLLLGSLSGCAIHCEILVCLQGSCRSTEVQTVLAVGQHPQTIATTTSQRRICHSRLSLRVMASFHFPSMSEVHSGFFDSMGKEALQPSYPHLHVTKALPREAFVSMPRACSARRLRGVGGSVLGSTSSACGGFWGLGRGGSFSALEPSAQKPELTAPRASSTRILTVLRPPAASTRAPTGLKFAKMK